MRIGLVVGRFQPFHKGHLYLFKKAIKVSYKIIIAVGSSNIKDGDNPLSYSKRVKMLRKVIANEGWEERILKIVPSPDDPSDDIWLKLLLKNTGKFDVGIGNNDWTNGILKKAGYKVLEVPYLKRIEYQGVIIRKLFEEGKSWEEKVPAYLIEFLEKEFSKKYPKI